MTPDEMIDVRMPLQHWENVLRSLAKQPFEVVAPLIAEIQRQCQMHELRSRAKAPGQPLPSHPEDYGPLVDGSLPS